MRLLLDTRIAVWAVLDEKLLSKGELDLVADPQTFSVLSVVSLWELKLKSHLRDGTGRRKGPLDPADVVAFATGMGWEILPLSARHAVATLSAPVTHKDPFDELLLVQAQEEGLRLLTRDTKLAGHPLVAAAT